MHSGPEIGEGYDWQRFMRKHWRTVATFAVAAVLAIGSAVYVFLWFVGNAQSTGLVPRTLGLWTMANLVSFILNAIFWELLLVGIPVVVAVIVAWAVVGETIWRGDAKLPPLSQALPNVKRWRGSVAVLLYRVLHQGLS